MGVVECLNHNLVESFSVLYEKDSKLGWIKIVFKHSYMDSHYNISILYIGEYVAQFKFTVLLMPNGPLRITNGPFDQDVINSSLSLDDPDLKVRLYLVLLLLMSTLVLF